MAKTPPKDPCLFCGVIHIGNCGSGKTGVRNKSAPRPPSTPKPVEPPPEKKLQPSRLDRMKKDAVSEWTPTVQAVPRRHPQTASITEAAIKADRQYHVAMDADTAALNAGIRALAQADLLGDKQLAEFASVIETSPSLEEEKILWRAQHREATSEAVAAADTSRPQSP